MTTSATRLFFLRETQPGGGFRRLAWVLWWLLGFSLVATLPVLAADADGTGDRLAERQPLAKVPVRAPMAPAEGASLGNTATDLGAPFPLRLVVKFRDDVQARSTRGALVAASAVDLTGVDRVARRYGMAFSPLIQLPETTLRQLETRAAQRSQIQQPDLAGWLVVTLSGADATVLEDAGNALQALPEVEVAHIQRLGVPPPGDIAPTTPNHVARQTYRGPDPGIDLDYAASQGLTGEGVRFSDCEFGWVASHEDLVDRDLHLEPGQTLHPEAISAGFAEHGTAVLGMTSAGVNGYGVSGMIPGSEVYTYPERSVEEGYRREAAITQAVADSEAGDVVLLEMQTIKFGSDYGPAELDPAVWMITKVATDAGVTVVAAAGNGSQDLDSKVYEAYMERGDSGAILVGAGTADTNHDKLPFSTYGSRVNLQGWGENVFTLGYGAFATYGGDDNQRYTDRFDGTSSASPMVATAAVLLQEAADKTLSPTELRELLIDTGIPQGSGGHIGPFVDLRAALKELPSANEPPTAHFTATCNRLQCTFDGRSSSDSDGAITSYRWTFPGGATATGAQTAFFVPGYGTHSVTLEVTDDAGATDTFTRNFYTGGQPNTTPRYGQWYNPQRSGHGIDFFRNASGGHVLIWYTYTGSGTPIWYISDTGPKVSSTWSEPLYKTTWNGTSASLVEVGTVQLEFSDPENAWFSWTIYGKSGGEHFRFLVGGPGRTGAWYDPTESGWGIQVDEQSNALVATLAFYVGSQPRWVQGQTIPSNNARVSMRWYDEPGLCPWCTGGSSTPPVGQPAGTIRLQIPPGSSTGNASTLVLAPGGSWYRFNVPISRLAGSP